jgi:Ran GTPase-activating protein (RanGAP) involved in mRNA processing and transport
LKYLGFYFDIVEEDGKVVPDPTKLIEFYTGLASPAACEKSYKTYKVEMTPDILNVFASIVGANDCLTEVNFSLCVFKEESFSIFLSTFLNSTNFKSIIIDTIEAGPNKWKSLADFLASSKSINKVDISGNKFSTDDLNLIGDAIVSNKNIKSIALSNSLDSETDPNDFILKLSTSTLEEVDLSFCDGSRSYSESFGKLLNGCLTLKTLKFGRKQEDFDSKVNNSIFSITNKLAIENLSISNIKFDGNSMKDLILNSDNLKTLSLNNSTKNTNFIKYFVERNLPLESLSFTVSLIDEEDNTALSKVLSIIKNFNLRPNHLEPHQAEKIFEGLNGNQFIQFFEIYFDKFEHAKYYKAMQKYYNNVITCDNLSNLMVYNLPEDPEESKVKNDLKENSKNFFLDFHKSLSS